MPPLAVTSGCLISPRSPLLPGKFLLNLQVMAQAPCSGSSVCAYNGTNSLCCLLPTQVPEPSILITAAKQLAGCLTDTPRVFRKRPPNNLYAIRLLPCFPNRNSLPGGHLCYNSLLRHLPSLEYTRWPWPRTDQAPRGARHSCDGLRDGGRTIQRSLAGMTSSGLPVGKKHYSLEGITFWSRQEGHCDSPEKMMADDYRY